MTIEQRLQDLERELGAAKPRNRWVLGVAGFAFVALAVVGVAWASTRTKPTRGAEDTNPVAGEVRANAFILEDAKSNTRATLDVDKDGPKLSLLDHNAKPRATLDVDKDGPKLSLLDDNAKPRATLYVDKYGPKLSVLDDGGKPRVSLGMLLDFPHLNLLDDKGNTRAILVVGKDGASLGLFDDKGNSRVSLDAENDRSELLLRRENRKEAGVGLSLDKEGPMLMMFDVNHKVVWSAPPR